MEDEEKEEQQEEAKGSGARDTILRTVLLKGAVGSVATDGCRWSGCQAEPQHTPVVLEEGPSGPYGLVPMSLVLKISPSPHNQ